MTIPPYEAWLVSCLSAGRTPEELATRPATGIWLPWVERLQATPPKDRAKAWRSWLHAPNFDAEGITKAITGFDPKGPAPELLDLLPADEDVMTTCLADVEAVPVEWLWPDRVPLGKITLLAGEAKMGKSFLTMDFIARVSAGLEIPGSPGECMPRGSVILLSAEDDPADTIVPRLIACNADLSKVHILTTIKLPSGSLTSFNLSYVPYLERAVVRLRDALLVLIDPVPHYVGNGTDDHKNAQTRQLLEPLKEMAARLKIAMFLVTHLNKGNGTKALNRVTGSGAYTALARSNWLVCKDKDDPKRRLFLSAGTNLVEDPSGLAYRIGRDSKRVEWEAEPIRMTADEALAEFLEASKGTGEPTKKDQAIEMLDQLFADGFPKSSEQVDRCARENGLKFGTINDAKTHLGIKSKKRPIANGEWICFPPHYSESSILRFFETLDRGEPPEAAIFD